MARRRIGLGSLIGLLAILFFGVVLLQRMWTFHAALSLAQGNAAHLERLYEESLNEAADWRNKYDTDLKQEMKTNEEKDKLIQALKARVDMLEKVEQSAEKQKHGKFMGHGADQI
ncbi:hypothetical protein KP509_23G058800 [Ceratopteris richardii]|uniref:Uncharacterized protein n=1 Tax=Ceratopteris richardii TaxID=49495 RepID=A0A8T2S2F1_CERRI|nr:hypothetical protein KP509_23G058800 [Ceratopteris richardii]